MAIFPLKRAGAEHLRSMSLEICLQKTVNDGDINGMDGFEFKMGYKYIILLDIKEFPSREISLSFCTLVCVEMIVACLERIGKRFEGSFQSKDLCGR